MLAVKEALILMLNKLVGKTSLSHKQADKQTVLLDIKQALIPAVKPASKISFHKVSSPAVNES